MGAELKLCATWWRAKALRYKALRYNERQGVMRLDAARLCLDCEEIHEEQECPACGSEAFAFLTRWIQSTAADRPKPRANGPERASAARVSPSSEHLDAWRHLADGTAPEGSRGRKLVTRSLLGIAAMGLAGWAWSKTGKSDES
jgi:hypothetical protein